MENTRMITATAISRDEAFIRLCTNEGIENWIKNTLQDVADELSLRTFNFKQVFTNEDYYKRAFNVIVYFTVSKSEAHILNHALREFKQQALQLIGRVCPFNIIDIQFKCELTEPVSMVYCELKKAGKIKEEENMKQLPEIKKIIHSGDYTHIIWADDSKTSVKKAEDMPYDAYSAFAQAVVKKLYGSTEKAKFEHELRQHSEKEQKKILTEKEARRAKQQKAEKKKIDRELKRQEQELAEKEKQVKATRAKRQSMFKRSEV